MTAGAYVALAILLFFLVGVYVLGFSTCGNTKAKICCVGVSVVVFAAALFGIWFYYHHTAIGQMVLTDWKSNIQNGLNRTITVYTADGRAIARYSGKIDIEGNDGGYVLFDYEGKRYTYYNCFVESVADIN